MVAYYNEIDPDAVAVLRQCIADGVIAPGEVDTRSIKEVQANDLRGFVQCHFFAGGGLWSVAARMAGWPDSRPLWTGSCPCQPFSAAGKGGGTDDPRHLWPDFHRLIGAASRAGYGPPVCMGEQVAGAAGYAWFDGVRADLASEGFAGRTVDIPACAVDAPHQRNRLYWIAVGDDEGGGRPGAGEHQAYHGEARRREPRGSTGRNGSAWADAEWIACHDGKARRAKSGLRLLVDGLPGRVGLWRVGGNAISPVLAAEVIGAFLDAEEITSGRGA